VKRATKQNTSNRKCFKQRQFEIKVAIDKNPNVGRNGFSYNFCMAGIRPKAGNGGTDTSKLRISSMSILYHEFIRCAHDKATQTWKLPSCIADDCEPGAIGDGEQLCEICIQRNRSSWVRNQRR
jgi:hypothetical protein